MADDFDEGPASIYDREAALAHLGNDRTVLRELAEMFLSSRERAVDAIRAAIVEHKARALYHAAHRLEGSLATFFAAPSIAAAQKLAESGRNEDWRDVEDQFAKLTSKLDRLTAALQQLLKEGAD